MGNFDSSIKEIDVKDILPRIKRTQQRFDSYNTELDMSNDEVNEIVHKLEDKLRPYDKVVSEFFIDKLLFDIHDEEIVGELVKLGDRIMQRYGTEPKQVMNALTEALDMLAVYVEPEGPVDEKKIHKLSHLKTFTNF